MHDTHPAPTEPAVAAAPTPAEPQFTDRETRLIQRAFRRKGTAALGNNAIADLFHLTEQQRTDIARYLAEQRDHVTHVVTQAADGVPIDTGLAMRNVRERTNTLILQILDEVQRAQWETVTHQPAALEGSLL